MPTAMGRQRLLNLEGHVPRPSRTIDFEPTLRLRCYPLSKSKFEIAIAIAITAFSPAVALAAVVGPLIEVPVMLSLVWIAMRLAKPLFRTAPQVAVDPTAVATDDAGRRPAGL
jgi:hypothetical protein